MASSVSSECVFSAAGITITKWRNRLKGDIVEALQVVKCAIRKELIALPPMPSTVLEEELEELELHSEPITSTNAEPIIIDYIANDKDYEEHNEM